MYQTVELTVAGKKIRGCVRRPDKENKCPAVCFYHGFTVDRTGLMRLHELFARECEKAGIVCVRFDFYGCGESDGDFSEVRFKDEVEQAKAIYDWTRKQTFVDPDKVFMAGHSLGGAVASIAAVDAQPRGMILWAPGNTAYLDISNRVQAIPGKYKELYDVEGLALSGEFLKELRQTDIIKESEGYRGNVLLVHGEKDEKIPIAAVGLYLDLYGKGGKLKIIEGANHQFSSVQWKNKLYKYSVDFMLDEIKDGID